MDDIIHGVVYLLDSSSELSDVQRQFAAMRELSLNTVVLWPPVFYKAGAIDVAFHQKVLEVAEKHNLKVVIELTGQVPHLEYMPDYLYRSDYGVHDADGNVVKGQNGLGEINLNHPEVKGHIKGFLETVVSAYKDFPALFAWDLWNETHFNSYDPYTMVCFQNWLREKYGTIEALNTAWARSCTAFEQVKYDPVLWASIVPEMDWQSFRTDNLATITRELTEQIHELDKVHPVMADNVIANTVWCEFDRGTDDWKVADAVDSYGISFYPKTGGRLLDSNTPWLRALTFAGARAAGDGHFMISELQSHHYSALFTAERVSENDLLLWDMEALACGAEGIVYWKWAPFRWGMQLGGRGLINADGSLSARASAVASVSKFLTSNPDFHRTEPTQAQIAILFDHQNLFAIRAINNRVNHIIGDAQFHKALYGLYQTCFEENVDVCIVNRVQLVRDIEKFKVVMLPYQVTLDKDTAVCLRHFMERGGTLICSYPFLVVDEKGCLHPQQPGGCIHDCFGGVYHYDDAEIVGGTIEFLDGDCLSMTGSLDVERVVIPDDSCVKVLARINGMPLLLQREVGKGRLLYTTADLWSASTQNSQVNLGQTLLRHIQGILPSQRFRPCEGIVVTTRVGDGSEFIFVFNYMNKTTVVVQTEDITIEDAELVFGQGSLVRDRQKIILDGKAAIYVIKIKTIN